MPPLTLDTAGFIALGIQVVLPILVGLITKLSTHPGVKAVMLLVLSAVNQILLTWADANSHHIPVSWKAVVWSTAIGFVISVAIHFGLWKPTSVSAWAQDTGVHD